MNDTVAISRAVLAGARAAVCDQYGVGLEYVGCTRGFHHRGRADFTSHLADEPTDLSSLTEAGAGR